MNVFFPPAHVNFFSQARMHFFPKPCEKGCEKVCEKNSSHLGPCLQSQSTNLFFQILLDFFLISADFRSRIVHNCIPSKSASAGIKVEEHIQ